MTRSELVLIIDLGTSSCKASLFKWDGQLAGHGSASYPERNPRPTWAEQLPEDWWVAAGQSTREALRCSESIPGQIAAIGVTGQMHGVLAVNGKGAPLTPCLTLRDRRAIAELQEITTLLSLDEVYRITGDRLAASLPPAKIRWMRKHWPEIDRKAQAYLAPKDYLRLCFTGTIATEVIDAAGMLFFDLRSRTWSLPIVEATGISPDKLPPIRAPWDLAGYLTGDAARHLGLLPGTPVYMGAGDDIEFLGYGIVGPGSALEHIGSTGSIMACVDRPVTDPAMTIELYPHIDPSLWLAGGSVSAAGSAMDWVCRVLLGHDQPGVETLLEIATTPGPPSWPPLVFLPYLAGERCPIWNPSARGGWLGLTLSHERHDLLRSALEGVVFALRHVLETIEGLAIPIPWLAVQRSGQDDRWLAMRANVYGRPLRVVGTTDATARGTLIVTGLGAGLYNNLEAGLAATQGTEEVIESDPLLAKQYEKSYALYRQISAVCQSLFAHFSSPRHESEVWDESGD